MSENMIAGKHTPGPWKACEYDGAYVIAPHDKARFSGSWLLATINGHVSGEENTANARLIAAAPTMYSYIERAANNGDEEALKIMQIVQG